MIRKKTGNIGVIHGRFQPFHLDHLAYALAAKSKCECLVVGITNPDPSLTAEDAADPARSSAASNPFSYFERMIMVREALLEAGIGRNLFEIVPFPINRPQLLSCYVPTDATFFMTIYDEWGRRKRYELETAGLSVYLLWERSADMKGIVGTEVRRRIAIHADWESLVPSAVARAMREMRLDERVSANSGAAA